ncbi:hypothetical protein SAMD00079811_66320 [Scytonema sp. HK-05]|nr:hypothetical protein SAMD00079811_66320 [Scytonema sp. HK-05]
MSGSGNGAIESQVENVSDDKTRDGAELLFPAVCAAMRKASSCAVHYSTTLAPL